MKYRLLDNSDLLVTELAFGHDDVRRGFGKGKRAARLPRSPRRLMNPSNVERVIQKRQQVESTVSKPTTQLCSRISERCEQHAH